MQFVDAHPGTYAASGGECDPERFNCLVGIVHHCGIDGTRPRGHTSLTGAIHAQLAVKRDKCDNIHVTVEYMKDGPEGEVLKSRLEVVKVITDTEGDAVNSCVIEPIYEEKEKLTLGKRREPIGQPKVALDLLKRALADAGERPPASNHIPEAVKGVVTLNLWRQYCYTGTVTTSDDPETKRQAFGRVAKKLQELNWIGVWANYVWIAP